jgi:hypothetical protein
LNSGIFQKKTATFREDRAMATDPARTQRRHLRDKATIDHLVQQVYRPEAVDRRQTVRSPTTSTGLPIEEQIRKEWDPHKMGGLPIF